MFIRLAATTLLLALAPGFALLAEETKTPEPPTLKIETSQSTATDTVKTENLLGTASEDDLMQSDQHRTGRGCSSSYKPTS